MAQKLVLLAGLSVILITTFIAVSDADDPCTLKQGIAFVANQPLGAVGFGHVAVGFLTCDGRFFFESLGPGNYVFPVTVKADIETESFTSWTDAENWLWNANYHKIKVIKIDNPDPIAAMNEINKPENYNLLASTAWDQETEDNCLTYTIKVLTAYGVNGLSTSPPTEAPNLYFEAYIPGKEYSWNYDLNRYSDSEGNTLSSDQAIQNAAVAGASNIGTQQQLINPRPIMPHPQPLVQNATLVQNVAVTGASNIGTQQQLINPRPIMPHPQPLVQNTTLVQNVAVTGASNMGTQQQPQESVASEPGSGSSIVGTWVINLWESCEKLYGPAAICASGQGLQPVIESPFSRLGVLFYANGTLAILDNVDNPSNIQLVGKWIQEGDIVHLQSDNNQIPPDDLEIKNDNGEIKLVDVKNSNDYEFYLVCVTCSS